MPIHTYDESMREKIMLALKDKRNGGIQAIYARIKKYGTPFKTTDGRRKYTEQSVIRNRHGLSKQTIHWRIRKGWSIEKAMNTPLRNYRIENDKNTGTDISDAVLAE